MNKDALSLFLIYFIVINIVGISSMFFDKRRAIKEQRRTPEKTLFSIAAFGGALGSLAGMYTFRHKTLHYSFTVGMPILLIFNIVCFYFYFKYIIFA